MPTVVLVCQYFQYSGLNRSLKLPCALRLTPQVLAMIVTCRLSAMQHYLELPWVEQVFLRNVEADVDVEILVDIDPSRSYLILSIDLYWVSG